MSTKEIFEEQYLLRVMDAQLADRLRQILRDEEKLEGNVELHFEDDPSGRAGQLSVGDQQYPVHVLDLPTVVESYKTYDDTNLVKTGDVGQMLVVGGDTQPGQVESIDGVTPPMRRARARHLRPKPTVPREVVQQVEQALIDILQGGAPAGVQFHDIEEEYVVDPRTKRGSWQRVQAPVAQQREQQREQAAAAAEAPQQPQPLPQNLTARQRQRLLAQQERLQQQQQQQQSQQEPQA